MAFPRSLGAVATAGLLLVGAKAQAQTCSPGLYVAVTAPLDGEVNVPTNALVDIRVAGNPIPSTIENEFGLRQPPMGQPIQVFPVKIPQSVPYILAIRLTPATRFLNPGVWEVVRIISGTAVTIATFTVGSSSDAIAPPPPVGASATVDPFDIHPDGGSDCIRSRVRRVRLTMPDAGKPVVYMIQEQGQTISSDEPSPVGVFYCTGQPQWLGDVSWVVAPGPHTIQLSAVSRAGYASPSVDVSFNADCLASAGDGGSPGQGGIGPPGGGRPADPTTTSCGCTSGIAGALMLGGFGLILRGRRRSHRR